MNLSEIKIEKIKKLIPRLLFGKLTSLNIENVDDLLEIDVLEFSRRKGMGRKAVNELYDLSVLQISGKFISSSIG